MNQEELIYGKMSNNYEYLMSLMGAIYNGQSLTNEELLQALGEVANTMLGVQRDYVTVSPIIEKDFLLNQIKAKEEALTNSLNSTIKHNK